MHCFLCSTRDNGCRIHTVSKYAGWLKWLQRVRYASVERTSFPWNRGFINLEHKQYFYGFVYLLLSLFCIRIKYFLKEMMPQSILPFLKHCPASFKDSVQAWTTFITQYLECCAPVYAGNHLKSSICNICNGAQTAADIINEMIINLSSCQSTFLIRHFYVPYKVNMSIWSLFTFNSEYVWINSSCVRTLV